MMSRSPSKRVIVEIKGGVGNQMFQYAAARSLSLELGAQLRLENRLGFILDRQYRGSFQLDGFPISYLPSSFSDSFPFFVDRVKSLYARRITKKGVKRNSRNRLFERDFNFKNILPVDQSKERFRLSGYYQDPRYFEFAKSRILAELTPPIPTDQQFLEIGNLEREFSLIALGIRIYEESTSPEAHARDGVTKTTEQYEIALAKLLTHVPNPLVLVFTSKEFDFLKSMKLPPGTIFVNPDRGFTHTLDNLWLMSKCKHHIFNNSTYYWWGATLSQLNYEETEQRIFCSDNFLNPEMAYPNWEKF